MALIFWPTLLLEQSFYSPLISLAQAQTFSAGVASIQPVSRLGVRPENDIVKRENCQLQCISLKVVACSCLAKGGVGGFCEATKMQEPTHSSLSHLQSNNTLSTR